MKPFKFLFFAVFFTFSILILIGKENQSTNLSKPMVETLKLSAYDSALDKIDYNVPYYKIRWPWKDDSQRREKRLSAVKKLLASDAGIHDDVYGQLLPGREENSFYVKRLGWRCFYSELDNTMEIPDKVDDSLLLETLPYIPEIEKIALHLTKVTDKGLESLFYLPILTEVSIDTPEPEQYPIPITDKGLVLVSKLPLLKNLFVRGVRLSDESLKELAKNGKQIKRFMYDGNGISNEGVGYLKDMPQLESLIFSHFVGIIIKGNTASKLTSRVFIPLSQSQSLKYIAFENYDFIQIPDRETLNAIKQLNKTKIVSVRLYHTKVHPLLVKALCNVQTLQRISFFDNLSSPLQITKENPISYEKVMYRLKQKDQVPQYYLELEKPYFDQFYSRKWNSPDIPFTGIASFLDLKEDQVTLKLKGKTTEISVPFSKLSKEDQQYVQQIVGK
jgi:hypothetical protein